MQAADEVDMGCKCAAEQMHTTWEQLPAQQRTVPRSPEGLAGQAGMDGAHGTCVTTSSALAAGGKTRLRAIRRAAGQGRGWAAPRSSMLPCRPASSATPRLLTAEPSAAPEKLMSLELTSLLYLATNASSPIWGGEKKTASTTGACAGGDGGRDGGSGRTGGRAVLCCAC